MAVEMKDFAITISQVLDGYGTDVREAVAGAVEKTGKKALKVVRQKSPVKTGEYKKGWRVKKSRGGLSHDQAEVTIYNAKKGWLTSMLENGYQKSSGGRVEGIPHVRPAYEEAERTLPVLTAQAIEEAGNRGV